MGTLPAKPSLDQLRKRAKDLARAEGVKLSEAQFRIARDHGFPSWPKLQAYVRRVAEHGETLQHPYHADVDYYRERAPRPARLGRGRDARRRGRSSAGSSRSPGPAP